MLDEDNCLLLICDGSTATFPTAKILRVNVSAMDTGPQEILCMGPDSNVTINGAAIDSNGHCLHGGRPITGCGMLHIKASSFTNNVVSGFTYIAGVVFADGGTTVIETSSFSRNAGASDCSAVGVTGRARLHILSSAFEGNSGIPT